MPSKSRASKRQAKRGPTPADRKVQEQLIREGKILYVASSNFAAWHIVKANAAGATDGGFCPAYVFSPS